MRHTLRNHRKNSQQPQKLIENGQLKQNIHQFSIIPNINCSSLINHGHVTFSPEEHARYFAKLRNRTKYKKENDSKRQP